MRNLTYVFPLLLLFTTSCIDRVSTTLKDRNDAPQLFQKLLEESIYKSFDRCYGVSMCLNDRINNVHWNGAAGFDSHAKTDSLLSEQPFRIASVSKTFVATAILRLHEEGEIDIDELMASYISSEHAILLKNDGYDLENITIRHCLQHSSGIFDYAMGSKKYLQLIEAAPSKFWSRTDQIKLAMEEGEPNFEPGAKYSYGDTGYVLLGEIVERQMDTTLGAALRMLINYDKLGLKSTWLEDLEEVPEAARNIPVVHRYYSKKETTNWNASVDIWGGGGLVSTNQDLSSFIEQLFTHKVFKKQETLDLMLEKAVLDKNYDFDNDPNFEDYRQGIMAVKIFGEEAFVHSGIWDTIMLYMPERKISIAINFTDGYSDRLLKKTIQALIQIENN